MRGVARRFTRQKERALECDQPRVLHRSFEEPWDRHEIELGEGKWQIEVRGQGRGQLRGEFERKVRRAGHALGADETNGNRSLGTPIDVELSDGKLSLI